MNPLRYRHLVDLVQRPSSPSTRSTTPRASRSSSPSGRSPAGAGCSASSSGPRAPSSAASRCSRRSRSGASRPRGRPRSRRSARRSTGPSPTSSSTAPTPSARRSTASTACSRAGTRLDPEDQATFCFDPRVIDWDHYVAARPPARRSSSTPGCAPRPAAAPARSREDRLRRQVLDPARHFAAFDLENTLIASNVVASYSWLATRRLPPEDRVRFVLKTLREAPALLAARPARPQRLPPPLLPPLRRAPTSTSSRRTPSRCSATSSSPSRSPPPSAGCASTAPSATARCSSPAPSTSPSSRCGPLFDDIVAPSLARRADGTYRGELTDVPPTGEARAQALFDYADGQRLRPRRVRRLRRLHLRPARCSRPSASRWRSTPRPASPPSPASAAGWSSTSTRPPGAPQPLLPIGPEWGRPRRRRVGKVDTVEARSAAMKALVVLAQAGQVRRRHGGGPARPRRRRQGRAARAARRRPARAARPRLGAACAPASPGICGSDLATIDGTSSRWFEPIVSFPFTPGHEVVGDLDDGRRVVVVPVLSCVARGIDPVCAAVRRGPHQPLRAHRLRRPRARPAVRVLREHRRRLVDADGRPREPARRRARRPLRRGGRAGRAHRLRRARRRARSTPAGSPLIGSGTLGLLTIAALRQRPTRGRAHRHRQAPAPARRWPPSSAPTRWSRPASSTGRCGPRTGSMRYDNGQLGGGVEAVVDCVGSAESHRPGAAHRRAPGGTIHAVGMPGVTTVDLTRLWQREVALRGAYAYQRADFDTAIELVPAPRPRPARHAPPTRCAATRTPSPTPPPPARRGAVKIAFDLRSERERDSI